MSDINNSKNKYKRCYICDKMLKGKYISQHYRRMHKNSDYCSKITRGLNYQNYLKTNTVLSFPNYYFCEICRKSMKMQSRFHHFNSIMHKVNEQEKNQLKEIKRNTMQIEELSSIKLENNISFKDKRQDIANINQEKIISNKSDITVKKVKMTFKRPPIKLKIKLDNNSDEKINHSKNKDKEEETNNPFVYYASKKYGLDEEKEGEKKNYLEDNNSENSDDSSSSSNSESDSSFSYINDSLNYPESEGEKEIREEVERIILKIEEEKRRKKNYH